MKKKKYLFRLFSVIVSLLIVMNVTSFAAVALVALNEGSKEAGIVDELNHSIYYYPITPEKTPDKWAEFESHSEMINACEIPEYTLNMMSTEQLLSTCINYPLMGDALCYNDIASGFELFVQHHNGLTALFKRNDISDVVTKAFSSIRLTQNAIDDSLLGILLITQYAVQKNVIAENDMQTIAAKCPALNGVVDSVIVQELLTGITMLSTASYSYTTTTVYTPNGSAVSGRVYSSDLTTSDKTYCNNYVSTNYPNATKISGPTIYYNCHSYAWYSSVYSTNHVWINNPSAYRTDGSYSLNGIIGSGYSFPTGAVHGNKAYYKNSSTTTSNDHSAIIYSSTKYTSKWGRMALMRHAQSYCPYYYNSSSTLIYIYER